MVTIRLARHGSKKKPFYYVTVAERSSGRDGRFVERLGFYNPVAKGNEEKLRVDVPRVEHWISQGAQPSDKVKALLAQARKNAAAAA
jgi:small subunit ribosomal protein S16